MHFRRLSEYLVTKLACGRRDVLRFFNGIRWDRSSGPACPGYQYILLQRTHYCFLISERKLQEVARWSFEALQRGKHPHLDHDSKPWPAGSERAALAGTDLAGGRFGTFVASSGDWKWNAETYGLPFKWNTPEGICHRCTASFLPGDDNFTKFRPCALRDNDALKSAVSGCPLSQISGWHRHNLMPEIMHNGPLGCCLVNNGSCLVELCDELYWPNGAMSGHGRTS